MRLMMLSCRYFGRPSGLGKHLIERIGSASALLSWEGLLMALQDFRMSRFLSLF